MSRRDPRKAPRHRPARQSVRVRFAVGPGPGHRPSPGRLVCLSSTGAAVALESLPPGAESGPVWLHLDGAADAAWGPARVVGTGVSEGGEPLIRLSFQTTCPNGFFLAAIGRGGAAEVELDPNGAEWFNALRVARGEPDGPGIRARTKTRPSLLGRLTSAASRSPRSIVHLVPALLGSLAGGAGLGGPSRDPARRSGPAPSSLALRRAPAR